LLDEQLDWRLERSFSNAYEVRSVHDMGWSGMRNGDLLATAQLAFDVLITMDRSLRHQQHLPRYDLSVIVLSAMSNRLADTKAAVPAIEEILVVGVEPGRLYEVIGSRH
jgi:predicted nuclease of predicted toxin-antitoxin system